MRLCQERAFSRQPCPGSYETQSFCGDDVRGDGVFGVAVRHRRFSERVGDGRMCRRVGLDSWRGDWKTKSCERCRLGLAEVWEQRGRGVLVGIWHGCANLVPIVGDWSRGPRLHRRGRGRGVVRLDASGRAMSPAPHAVGGGWRVPFRDFLRPFDGRGFHRLHADHRVHAGASPLRNGIGRAVSALRPLRRRLSGDSRMEQELERDRPRGHSRFAVGETKMASRTVPFQFRFHAGVAGHPPM